MTFRTTTNPKFRNSKFDGMGSSPEILEAIEDVAGFELLHDGQDDCPAYRVWADPTPEEEKKVIEIAWAYADPEEDTLHWGRETIRRPTGGT
jgi:hypothetical protein